MAITNVDGHVHIDFDKIAANARKGVRRASAFMGFSLNAAADPRLVDFHPHGSYVRIVPENLSEPQIAEYKDAYQHWAIANGIRELVESFGLFLNGIYLACNLMRFGRTSIASEIQKKCLAFEQKSEFRRLKILNHEMNIRPSQYLYLQSFVEVRNAITHRWGQVLKGTLEVRWIRLQPFVRADDGSEVIVQLPVVEEVHLEKGGRLFIRHIEASKTFNAGESVRLSPNEAHEICFTVESAIGEILRQIGDFAAKENVSIGDNGLRPVQ